MNNVISKKTKCLNVKKFSFPQTVKLDLRVKKYLLSVGTEDKIS